MQLEGAFSLEQQGDDLMSHVENVRKSISMAKAAGYEVWETNGREAFGKTLKDFVDGDHVTRLELLIEIEDQLGVDGDPADAEWMVNLEFNGVEIETFKDLTLADAIEVGSRYEARTDEIWSEQVQYEAPNPSAP